MGEQNGFVERPETRAKYGRGRRADSLIGRLRASADNGKAVVVPKPKGLGGYNVYLRSQGYQLYSQKRDDGQVVAWCERITPSEARQP